MKNLITLDCEQGSEAWRQARLGIPTASQYKRIMTNTGAASEQATAYLAELIAERITGQPADGYTSDDMTRGSELEPQARAAYEFATGNSVQQVGGVYLDDSRSIMASPDGLMPELRRGLEIKCPKLSTHIRYILDGVMPREYRLQVQGGMLVTGYDSWDFVSYHPDYTPQTTWILTVRRDDNIIAALEQHLRAFVARLEAEMKGLEQ